MNWLPLSPAALLLVAIALPAQHANATIIDSRPFDDEFFLFGVYKGYTAGGNFVADDIFLGSFTVDLRNGTSGFSFFRSIVMDTTGGTPNAVVWSTDEIAVLPGPVNPTFTLNLAITPGDTYFVGIDAGGQFPPGKGSALGVGYRDSAVIAGGEFLTFKNGSWTDYATRDISAQIVMNSGPPVPEPATAGLVLLAAAPLLRRRRTA